MRLSEERITHIAHLICDRLYKDDLVDYPNDDEALKLIKKTLLDYLQIDDQIDDEVRRKITSLNRGVSEASREWEILYKKYYEEEAQKRKFSVAGGLLNRRSHFSSPYVTSISLLTSHIKCLYHPRLIHFDQE